MEIVGQDKPSPEDLLVHFGVLGMHWGVRKQRPSARQPGRIRAAAEQGLYDEARRRRRVAKSRFLSNLYVPNATRKHHLRAAAKQERAARRIRAGQTTVMDFLRAYRNTSVLDLFVKTTPLTQNNRPK